MDEVIRLNPTFSQTNLILVMQPFPTKPIGPIKVDPDLLKKLEKFLAPCHKAFPSKFATIKKGPIVASVSIVPFKLGAFDSLYFTKTAVTFKALDAVVTAKATQWKAEIPTGTIAYAEFGPVDYTGHASDFEAILFVSPEKVQRMYLKRSATGHTWSIDYEMAYCNKPTLFVLNEATSSLFVHFDA